MNVRQFKLYGDRELRAAADRTGIVIRAWLEKWAAVETVLSQVEALPFSGSYDTRCVWRIGAASDESSVALATEPEWLRMLPLLLTGQEGEPVQSDSLGSKMADGMVCDLFVQLPASLGMEVARTLECRSGPIPAHAGQMGSGYLSVIAHFANGGQLRLLFWPELAGHFSGCARTPGEPVALCTAEKALEQRPVKLEVAIGEADLTFDELQTLAIGDVISLKRGLKEALSLQIDSMTPVWRGYLGSVRGRVALQISQK